MVKVIEWCPASVASRASQVESAIGLDQQQGNDYKAGLNLVFTVGTLVYVCPWAGYCQAYPVSVQTERSQLNWLWVSLADPRLFSFGSTVCCISS